MNKNNCTTIEIPRYRINNDIPFKWKIKTTEGGFRDFRNSNINVYLMDPFQHPAIIHYFVEEDGIVILFAGKDQKYTGLYSLLLEENKGMPENFTFDNIHFMELVPHNYLTQHGECSGIDMPNLEVQSDEILPRNGLSNYDLARLAGFKGSLQDYLDSLKGEKGDQGPSGNINYPTFYVNDGMHLIMRVDAASDKDRFKLNEQGHLILIV